MSSFVWTSRFANNGRRVFGIFAGANAGACLSNDADPDLTDDPDKVGSASCGEEILPPDIKDFDGVDGKELGPGLRIPTRRGVDPALSA